MRILAHPQRTEPARQLMGPWLLSPVLFSSIIAEIRRKRLDSEFLESSGCPRGALEYGLVVAWFLLLKENTGDLVIIKDRDSLAPGSVACDV